MKVPPGYRFREGDIVTVKATIRFDTDPDDSGNDRIHIKLGYTNAAVDPKDILSLEGRVWHAGDRVRNRNVDDHVRGEVIAFCEGLAWVKWSTGAFATYPSLDLEELEPIVKEGAI